MPEMTPKIKTIITEKGSKDGFFQFCSGCQQHKQLKLCETCHKENNDFSGYCFFCRRHPDHDYSKATEQQRKDDMIRFQMML